jgi:diguanylate cyclase (GGDEF)-like protein
VAQTDVGAIPLFQGLPDSEIARLNRLAHQYEFTAGEAVMREGEEGVGVYVVTEGTFEVRHDYPSGDVLIETTLGPGDIFGLTSMLDEGPRRASVYALTDGSCLVLTRVTFRQAIATNPTLAIEVMRTIARELRDTSTALNLDLRIRKPPDEQHIVLFDMLTGLPNRSLLEDRLRQSVLAAVRGQEPLPIQRVELDRFKDVNDALGHGAGDEVLSLVAERIRPSLRTSDTLARLIGDEFVVLLRDSTSEHAQMVAERIRRSLQEPFWAAGQPIILSATIGIASYPDHGKDGEELLHHADVALRNARGTHVPWAVYRYKDDEHMARRLRIRSDLHTALETDQLLQYYQPKRMLRSGMVNEVEALVRWNHPDYGFVPPMEFIGIAEQTASIKPLTLWALRSAIRQITEWKKAGLNLAISVNLSATDLQDLELPEVVTRLLGTYGAAPGLLTLEVTESMLMVDPDRARFVLDQLRGIGARISIDDFGTGYSSLAYLSRLAVDELKIDRSFVAGLTKYEHDRHIVAATIELGHRLGLSVAAEGVEDQPTEDLLRGLRCDSAQGYYVAYPLPPDELTQWLEELNRVG